VVVVDQTARRSLLIEAEPQASEDLRRRLPRWLIAEQVTDDRPESKRPLPSDPGEGEAE